MSHNIIPDKIVNNIDCINENLRTFEEIFWALFIIWTVYK
jgi:hypothetical protein